jgi:hypothetical protein
MSRRGVKKHFKSGWNRYEMLCYILNLTSLGFAYFQLPLENVVHSSTAIVLWIGILDRIRGFKVFSVLIATFTQIIKDIRVFIIIVGVIMIGFSLGFKFLIRTGEEVNNFSAFATVYSMMYGMTEIDFILESENRNVEIAGYIYFILFMFLVVIVLLNMLIAIMGDSYDNVTENIRVESIRSNARVCADLLIDYAPTHALFTRWLHVCVIKDEGAVSNRNTWEGKVKAMKNEINKLKSENKNNFEGVKKEMENVRKGVKEEIKGVNKSVEDLKTQLSEIMTLLRQKEK